ncbi:MAG TPA: rhomboid family intramembrane serine protease, partial [Longimicrobium sp.]|nr:rhomboid family intramembrane serine protease [Longimicrobium sp.]
SPPPSPEEEQRRAIQALVREAAARSPYGYFEEHPVPSTREELLERLRQGRPTPLVWTPETLGVVPTWTVPYLFEAYRAHGLRHARNLVVFWGAVAGLLGIAVATAAAGTSALLFAMLAGVLLVHSAVEYRTFRALTPDKLRTEVREIRSRPPPRRGPPRMTRLLAGVVAAVFVAQVLPGIVEGAGPQPAIDAAVREVGIDKEAVRQGWWWLLLTGTVVHGHVLHFVMNALGLMALGRILEAFSHRAFVPLVFLLSAIGGSVASQLLLPEGFSVGASGGIMGMFGFLAVMAVRRRHLMPPGVGRAIAVDVGVIVMMGIVGYGLIDNAAHGGGMLAGALVGVALIPKTGAEAYWDPPRWVQAAGHIALAGVIGIAALAIYLIARLYLG